LRVVVACVPGAEIGIIPIEPGARDDAAGSVGGGSGLKLAGCGICDDVRALVAVSAAASDGVLVVGWESGWASGNADGKG
jgi:hypothetical protein